jgi:hypothetical protein
VLAELFPTLARLLAVPGGLGILFGALVYRRNRGLGVALSLSSFGLLFSLFVTDAVLDPVFGPSRDWDRLGRFLGLSCVTYVFGLVTVFLLFGVAIDWFNPAYSPATPPLPELPPGALKQGPSSQASSSGVFRPSESLAPPPHVRPEPPP